MFPTAVSSAAQTVARSIGPAVGLTVPALLRHRVWRGSGDDGGTGVIVVPGLAGTDASMAVLRRWLTRRGHAAVGAGLRLNVGCTSELVTRLERRAEEHAAATGGPVVLLGHSRGGMLARLVAVRRPDLVRGLAMLGSPVLDPLDVSGFATVLLPSVVRLSAFGVPGLLDGDCLTGPCGDSTAEGLAAPLPVPAVAIYSRQDGVVGWRSCQDPEAEWVEVTSSHTGMGTDPELYAALAPRLADWAVGNTPRAQRPRSSTRPASEAS